MAKNKKETKNKIPFNVLRKGALTAMLGLTILGGATMMSGCTRNGTDGKDGTIWKSGTSYTEFTDAKAGDFFIDTDDYILYQKTADSWSIVMENYGRPGNTPQAPSAPIITINAEGYWVIDGVPTSTKAKGEDGEPGATPKVEIKDGFWYINDVKSVKAEAEDGHTPVITINGEGYWVIDGVPSEIKATPSVITIVDGYWHIDGTTTGVKAEGKDGATWLSGEVAPTTEGKDGDFYLNENTYDIYKKTDGEWAKIGNIKGADGIDGEDGETVENTLPDYWKTYLDTKIAEINSKGQSYGGNTDAFIFITDQHLQTSLDYSSEIINYITEHTSIKKVILGGDIVQGGSSDNTVLRKYRESFNDDTLVMAIRGNHDVWGKATENSFYDIMVRPLLDKVEMSNELYYCYDNDAQKIRYIFTDSTYASTDGNNNLTDNEQIEWMKSKILELESDWTAMVFHHGIWTASKNPTIAINNDGQLMIDAIDSIYDQAECTIAGIYSGHAHRDYVGYSEKGYALVSTTLDCSDSGQSTYDVINPSRPSGTTKEQTFDVVFINPATNSIETIRIGAGDNRTITYGSNETHDVTGVTLNKTTASTWVGGNGISLSANITPSNASNKQVTWTITSGEGLGTITPNGLNCTFTPGSSTGTVVVEVKTVDGDYTATCTIEISAEATTTDITNEFTWNIGAIKHADGTFVNDNNWMYSSLVDVSTYKSITFTHIQTPTSPTSLGYAFYDANQKYISGESNTGLSYTPVEKTIDIPSNAKYFRTMWISSASTNYNAGIHEISTKFYCEGNSFSVPKPVQGVSLNKNNATVSVDGDAITLSAILTPNNADNQSVTWSITSGEGLGEISSDGLSCTFTPSSTTGEVVIQVKTVDGEYTAICTITIVEEISATNLTSQFTWTPGTTTAGTGATSSADTNWLYSNMVDVSAFSSITFTHIQTTNMQTSLGYAFYGENQNYVSGATNGGSSYAPVEKTIDVPEGAKYFRVMWINTSHSDYNAEIHNIDTCFSCYGNP